MTSSKQEPRGSTRRWRGLIFPLPTSLATSNLARRMKGAGTILLITLLAVMQMGVAMAGDWSLIKHEGRDYVTLENVADFYGFGGVRRVSNGFELGTSDRGLRVARGSKELFINKLKFILSYPAVEKNGRLLVSRMDLTKIIEPVLRPSRIRGAEKIDTVILDPGHGGHDRGARSRWGDEKNFSLDVARRTRELLRKSGYKVYLTRESDVFIPLDARVRFANKFSNAIFISIHFNSGQPAAAGVETYTLAPRGVPSTASDGPRVSDLQLCAGNTKDAENMALATATHAALISRLKPFDRGIKRARFVVIRDITIPGVLIEGGFLSNAGESRRIASSEYRQTLADAIARAVQHYRTAVGPSRRPASLGPLVELKPKDATASRRIDESTPNAPLVVTPTAN